MKNIVRLIATFLTAAFLFSCEKAPEISVSTLSIKEGSAAVTKSVDVTTNYEWTAKSSASWLKITPSSGEKGTTKVTISLDENTTPDERSATVTISCKDLTVDIPVTQAQKDVLTVEGEKVSVPAEGKEFQIKIQSNVTYSVSVNYSNPNDASWIKETSTKALNTYTHTFSVAANPGYEPRSAVITFTPSAGGQNIGGTYIVEQDPKKGLILSEKEFTFDSQAHAFSVTLSTNVDYEVVMPDVTWISQLDTKALKDYTLSFGVDENEDYDARSAEILIREKGSDLSETIKISQAQKNAIILSSRQIELEYTGGSFDVKLQANVDYEIKIKNAWIEEVDTKGLSEYVHTFVASENPDKGQRSGQIIFYDRNTKAADTLTVHQLGKDIYKILRITHGIKNYTLPTFTGDDLTGTIDWGDGKSEKFANGKTHTYKKEGTYTVVVELENAQGFSVPDVENISAFDISKFRE